MSLLGRNIASSFGARTITSLLAFLFIPVYLRILGIEAWGLIAFSLTLQGILVVFDVGLGLTLNRELARLPRGEAPHPEARDLIRTFEIVSWSIAVLAGAVVILASPWIARAWIHPEGLTRSSVETSIRLMGVMLGLQIPFWLYRGGLFGLEQHVILNAVTVGAAAFRHAGAAAILLLISPTVEAYFRWSIAAVALQTMLGGAALWSAMGGRFPSARFRLPLLVRSASFTAAISINALVAPVLGQIDKIVLSAAIPLAGFGVYSLAWTLAAALWMLISPVTTAVFPAFARLTEEKNEAELSRLYHSLAQGVTALVAPIAMVLLFFPGEIVFLWSGDPDTAARAAGVLRNLAIGTTLTGVASLPITLQMAAGMPRLVLLTNLAAVCALVPAALLIAPRFGGEGMALLWVALGLAYVLVTAPAMHRFILRNEYARWLIRDLLVPGAAAAGAMSLWRLAAPSPLGRGAIPLLIAAWATATALTLLVSPEVRRRLVAILGRWNEPER
ncbi:MAG TPA: oligosaccharide flippase family protein [Longimicrobiaceae bacterium]|nr:oligosaccharide flippase family protein [Longimicrobiaceae bacterium]